MSTPLNLSIVPRRCNGTVRYSPMVHITSLQISLFEHATAKLSTCLRNRTLCPRTNVVYIFLSCVVFVKFSFSKILLMCFSHNLGLSGCPCIACFTGRTHPLGIDSQPLCFVHQFLNCSSIFMYNGATGAGASANALLASAPSIIMFLSAASE